MNKQATEKELRQFARDQREVATRPPDEIRKGVNVLNTSDPKNPAPNPFVVAQNESVGQAAQSNGNTNSKGEKPE